MDSQRTCLVEEARSWIGTPYRLRARVKGAGCDCATFLAEVLIACGFADREELGVYAHDWFHHTSEERYLLQLVRHAPHTLDTVAYQTSDIQPGSIVLTHAARSKIYNHGGVVIAWPKIVHAIAPAVEEADAGRHPLWAYHAIAVFDPLAPAAPTC